MRIALHAEPRHCIHVHILCCKVTLIQGFGATRLAGLGDDSFMSSPGLSRAKREGSMDR